MRRDGGEVVAVIPARGGSKGVLRKNVRQVGGLPLVARAILSANACSAIDRVVVSTDDDEIALIATTYGAEIVARPPELATDEASSETALLHSLDTLEASGIRIRTVAFIQPTSPFIDEEDLSRAVKMVDGDYDVVFSAVEDFAFLWRFGANGAEGVNHDHTHRERRQERQVQYRETGAFYVMRSAGFQLSGFRFFGRVGAALVSERDSLEIDSEEQLELAELLATGERASNQSFTFGGPAMHIDVDAVVTDFDGVHTDDHASISEDGSESVVVSRSDGMGIRLLREAGIPVLILSTETNPVVQARAAKLGVDAVQGVTDKRDALFTWAVEQGIDLERVAYLGNDVNDLGCLELVGWPIAVFNAHKLVLEASRFRLTKGGGEGAVRELAEHVINYRKVRLS